MSLHHVSEWCGTVFFLGRANNLYILMWCRLFPILNTRLYDPVTAHNWYIDVYKQLISVCK